LALTKDGRLMHADQAGWGAQQLAENMPPGQVHWYTVTGAHHYAIVGRKTRQGLFVIDLNTASVFEPVVRRLELTIDKPLAVDGHAGVCLVFGQDDVEAFDVSSGTRLGGLSIPPGLQRRHGRYFTNENSSGPYRQWYALGYGAEGLVLDEAFDEQWQKQRVIGVIDAEKVGPLCVYSDGSLHSISVDHTTKPINDCVRAKLVGTSRDRQWVVLRAQHNGITGLHAVEIATGRHERASDSDNTYWEPELSRYPMNRTVRHRFRAIMVDEKGRLTLIAQNGERFPLQLSAELQSIVLPRKGAPPAELESISVTIMSGSQEYTYKPQAALPFEREDDAESRYDLRHAHWPDGSMAVLDGRGLLHLRSADATIPEFSIVLTQGATAGWVSDGRRWGPQWFHGHHPVTASAESIYQELLQAFVGRLP
jgi:hypothetical protein